MGWGWVRDNPRARRRPTPAQRKPHRRQEDGTCPAAAPVDCNRQDACCPLSSECVGTLEGGTICVASESWGQTFTVGPLPKETVVSPVDPTDAPISTTLPTATSTEQATGLTISLPTETLTTTTTATTLSSSAVTLTTSSSIPPFSNSTPTAAAGACATPASSSASTACGIYLTIGQLVAIIVAPTSAFILGIIAYCLWRHLRKKKRSTAGRQFPTPSSPRPNFNMQNDDDEQPMTEASPGATRNLRSIPSTQHSMATTLTLLNGTTPDDPLRSHPVTLLGVIPQSPAFGDWPETASFDYRPDARPAPSHDDDDDGDDASETSLVSSVSTGLLMPFQDDDSLYGPARYSASPMRYVMQFNAPEIAQAGEATVEEWPSSSNNTSRNSSKRTKDKKKRARHKSWAGGVSPFGRQGEWSDFSRSSLRRASGDWALPWRRSTWLQLDKDRPKSMPEGEDWGMYGRD